MLQYGDGRTEPIDCSRKTSKCVQGHDGLLILGRSSFVGVSNTKDALTRISRRQCGIRIRHEDDNIEVVSLGLNPTLLMKADGKEVLIWNRERTPAETLPKEGAIESAVMEPGDTLGLLGLETKEYPALFVKYQAEEDSASAAEPAESPKPSATFTEKRTQNVVAMRTGNLLTANVEAIVQQCNCLSCEGRGLSAQIASSLPHGNPYGRRRSQGRIACPEDRDTPGQIDVARKAGSVTVISIFGQWESGAPLKYNRAPCPKGLDSKENREKWFQEGLDLISQLRPMPKTIGFPFLIGCGLGGGDWHVYKQMIYGFARQHPEIRVSIFKFPDAPPAFGPSAAGVKRKGAPDAEQQGRQLPPPWLGTPAR